jgi:hypothetical protein
MMSKVTFLVLAAIAPSVLRHTCQIFRSDKFEFIVHVDQKCDIQQYTEVVGSWPHLKFLGERHSVFWAGFSMIEATMALVAEALQGNESSHFALISDNTFPIYSPNDLYFKISSSGKSWIECWRLPKNHLFQQRYQRFFYLDSQLTSPRWYPTEERDFRESDAFQISELERIRKIGKKEIAQLYCGKQWWVLTREEIQNIFQMHISDHHLRDSFRFSAVTDEIYIQTLYKMIYPDRVIIGNPMYDDFGRSPKPYVFSDYSELSLIFDDIRSRAGADPAIGKYLFLRKVAASSGQHLESLGKAWGWL